MEETIDILPTVFMEFIERVNKIEQLNASVMAEYYTLINDDKSMVPELVAVLGPNSFELLVKYFGGNTIKIPKTEDILSTVRKSNAE